MGLLRPMRINYQYKWENHKTSVTVFCLECRANAAEVGKHYLTSTEHLKDWSLCEKCGTQAIKEYADRTVKVNRQIQKFESCPECHVTMPLAVTPLPVDAWVEAQYAIKSLGYVERACVGFGTNDWTDRVYPCGCREHRGHFAGQRGAFGTLCVSHQPIRETISLTGCCYVCEAPLTTTAKSRARAIRKTLDEVMVFELEDEPEVLEA